MPNPALAYEQDNVPAIFGPCAERLLQLAPPGPGERALDVACGTGVIARKVAGAVGPSGSVAALDMNPDMLEVARAAAAAEGAVIDWREGTMDDLPFPDGDFDLVLCQHGLQFAPDRAAVMAEFHRVLRPGGRVAVCTWKELSRHPYLESLNGVVERCTGIPALVQPFSLHSAEEVAALLEGAGFQPPTLREETIEARFPDPEGYVAHEADVLVAALPALQHLDEGERERLSAGIVEGMGEAAAAATREGVLVVPFHAMLALATKP